jgi:hypothetical protein
MLYVIPVPVRQSRLSFQLLRHVGCKVAAAVGAAGVAGCALIVTLVGAEIHPAAFLTVTEYVAAVSKYSSRVGISRTINAIRDSSSSRTVTVIVPVATAHVGCKVAAAVAAGVAGCVLSYTA